MDLLKELQALEAKLQDALAQLQFQINAIKAVGEDKYELKVEVAQKPG